MIRYCSYRLLIAIPLLFVVSAVTFVLTSLTPGDAATQILGVEASPEQRAALRAAFGLDLPVHEQYAKWLTHALGGDLGHSILQGQSVLGLIGERLPVTLSLLIGALLVSAIVGCSLGVLSAVRGGVLGRILDTFSLVGWALPVFWVGAELVVIFAITLKWLPAVGYVPFADSPVDWLRSLILPVAALSLGPIAAIARQTRESMLDVLASEHIRMSRANGVRRGSLIYRHALRNASIPVVTVMGVQAIGMLGGAILIEAVFQLPGLGTLVVTSSLTHDLPVVQGVAVVFALIVIVVNLAIDLVYGLLNPKVRVR